MPIHDHIESLYLRILPEMMENPAVWEIIKNRTPEKKDDFLHDRFMSSCRHAFYYLKEGHTYEEWMEHGTINRAMEPILAQTAYESAQYVHQINRANQIKPNAALINLQPEITFPLKNELPDARISLQIQEQMGFTAHYVYSHGEITYNGDPYHESRWLDKEREVFKNAFGEIKTETPQTKLKEQNMNYILTHNEDFFGENIGTDRSGRLWFVKHIPDHMFNKENPLLNTYRFTENIDEALLVPKEVKDAYLEYMQKEYSLADAYECEGLTPEAKIFIQALAKRICWDNNGETVDRYTVVSPNGDYVAMSSNPFAPQGFGQHGEGCAYSFHPCNTADGETIADGGYIEKGKDIVTHLGTMITFDSLPEDCKKLVKNDVKSELSTGAEITEKINNERENSNNTTTETRKSLLGDLYHPAYETKIKLPKYNYKDGVTVEQASGTDSGKVLIKSNPDWNKTDHQRLSQAHKEAADKQAEAWSIAVNNASRKTFGRDYHISDYKISAIARDEFSSADKKILRHLALSQSEHKILSKAHDYASKQINRYKAKSNGMER